MTFSACSIGTNRCYLTHPVVFPNKFSALQTIKISKSSSGYERLLAAIVRQGENLRISLLDAVLQIPIVDFEMQNGKIIRQDEFFDIGPFKKDLPRFLMALDQFYRGIDLECSERKITFSKGPIFFDINSMMDNSQCTFPEEIHVAISNKKEIHIRVHTEELTCEP